jgi:transcriptional regulator with XRE-family HTH domain
MMGLSQTTLATKIGLTFQQVQKYERGANRVSASMMWRMGEVLDVPISYFFDGLERSEPAGQPDQWDPAVLRLARRIRTLPLAVRNSLASLVGSLVNDSDDDADVEIIEDELAASA